MEFETAIVRLPGKIAWPVFYILRHSQLIRRAHHVLVTLDGAQFHGTLVASSNGITWSIAKLCAALAKRDWWDRACFAGNG